MGIIVQSVMRLLSLLPLRVHYALGRFVSWMAEKVLRYRVWDVAVNLARSFPDLKYDELKDLQHKFYIHFGELFAEGVWFGGCRNPERLRRKHLVEIENPEEINRLYDLAPSVMVLMTHSGNWELTGGMESFNYTGTPCAMSEDSFVVVYRLQSLKFWNNFLKVNRTAPLKDRKHFDGYLESRNAVRYVFEHKDEKKIYNFITDQYPYEESKGYMRLYFMNQKCISMKGAAELARRMGMAVCYMSMPQVRRGLYKIRYIPICEDASAMRAEDIMRRYYSLLEADIKAQPWNYLWAHRRWKDETGEVWKESN